MRVLWLIALVWLGICLWRVLRQHLSESEQNKSQSVANSEEDAIEMVVCAVCAVHVPRSEAIVVDGHSYCSQAHRQQAKT